METKMITQTISFEASADEVYQLLMDEKKHAEFTGTNVTMSRETGGKFDVYDGYCTGYNIELIEGSKIVQAWHFAEDGWADNHYSICTFIFENEGTNSRLFFTQTGIPEHKVEELENGWKEFYWEPMKVYLKNN